MSQFDAHERRYVPELEALKDWIRLSLLLVLAVILPITIAYCVFVVVNW